MKKIMFILIVVGHLKVMGAEFRTLPSFFIGTIKNNTAQKIDVVGYDTLKTIASIAAQTSKIVNYPVNLTSKDFLKEFKLTSPKSNITLTIQHSTHKKNYFDVLLYVKKGIMGKSQIISSWSNATDPQKNYNINVILQGEDLMQSVINVVPTITTKQSSVFEL
ncbi:hypothetical protein Noda2021_08510 [Candidatus Dependentiae bacterium Noda2021]|nr:hypothetical protein Noda2021_08510 [Candidatus Dependentiae bacterium Noda2021]